MENPQATKQTDQADNIGAVVFACLTWPIIGLLFSAAVAFSIPCQSAASGRASPCKFLGFDYLGVGDLAVVVYTIGAIVSVSLLIFGIRSFINLRQRPKATRKTASFLIPACLSFTTGGNIMITIICGIVATLILFSFNPRIRGPLHDN